MRNRRGFTLMELIIMIAVASILLVGMGMAVKGQMKAALDNRDYLIALNIAKQQMAIMNANPTIPIVGTTAPADIGFLFPGFTLSQVVTEPLTSGGHYLRRIQMDVFKGSTLLVRLYTYRTDIVTFGNGT